MSNEITPPPELVRAWLNDFHAPHPAPGLAPGEATLHIAAKAARWGADQELEACCKYMQHEDFHGFAKELRAARRPKPPSLKEVALQMLSTIERDAHYLPEITDTIRRALERLQELENND